ncbi:MAG: hypothetical protein VYD59_04795 [Bacteroidota bacterium]|nr:hypothetical protein [Bacteroidota bacterium]|tara:strand:+ start:1280 stop:1669 length:390 start_codon:yes stop_codon:yes gene_type:complete
MTVFTKNKIISLIAVLMLFISCFLPLSSYSINIFELAKVSKQYFILILPLVAVILFYLIYLDYLKIARWLFAITLLPFFVSMLYLMIMVDINIEMFSMIGSGTYLIIFSLVIGIKYSKSDDTKILNYEA